MRYLIIAAHPDDEVLGCGGTMAKLVEEKNEVYVAILGEGITSRFTNRDEADKKALSDLHDKSNSVADLLGIKKVFMYDLPDNRFDTVPILDVIKKVENLIQEIEPAVIYTQNGGDLNVDHQVTFRATMTATRPMKNGFVKELYTFEVPSSTEWSFNQFQPAFQPNVFIDISSTLETKIKAMALYEGEAREFPHPRSPEVLRALAAYRGSQSGQMASEAFTLIRKV